MQKHLRFAAARLLGLLWWTGMLAALLLALLVQLCALCALFYLSLKTGDLLFDSKLAMLGTAVALFFGLFCFFRQYELETMMGGIMTWFRDRMEPVRHIAEGLRQG